eukprot:CAMPEP_0116145904 /NCGR_PEP_ID=MMETSP0329-20121206/16873_1 /TAXON_ID=697910 /ORGANISM="Pseudo-nitzschia arenysensis, Strain B593" /LENGTH=1400 /DNA_ID=CAMNT_0003641603 /DNA_START=177 /DNA_END=4379 /DNA_ORIENTATION=-
MAKRLNGVTQGSMYKVITISSSQNGMSPKNNKSVFSLSFGKRTSSASTASQQPSETTQTYSVLVGVKLICHESLSAMTNGDRPLAHYSLVGVSPVSDDPTAFRAVTDKGTHLLCTVPTKACRDVWLSALNAGLEYMLSTSCKSPQHQFEERAELGSLCGLAQGVLEHCYWVEELYATHQQEQDTMLAARKMVLKKLSKKKQSAEPQEELPDRDANGRLLPKSHTLSLEPISHHVLGLALESSKAVALQRQSPTLRSLCAEFQQGIIGVMEFVELLESAIGIRDPAMVDLKKQAFRVAGDMGTALKLLYEQCIPEAGNSGAGGAKDSTELLQCILEFFLDLVVEEDELNTLAFFWPQISNIHLQMLPPRDTLSLQKIELVEDFLLTVATKHSVHLAIELIWSHTADLEDALSGSYHGSTSTFCGRRKSAVLRFLCELESLLFDFDKGWGGGSVTIGHFMSPSSEQIDLLKESMYRIQNCRLAAVHDRLTRSHRLEKLQKTKGTESTESPELMAKEKVRMANNADYLSSHLAFTKRLCDVAEKLRFLPLNERKAALCTELGKLNASGTMGGDPTNVIKDNNEGHTRMVRIPIMEGHVFRSKARTPVLLLVETIDEGAILAAEQKEEEEQALALNETIEEPSTETSDDEETASDAVVDGEKPSEEPDEPVGESEVKSEDPKEAPDGEGDNSVSSDEEVKEATSKDYTQEAEADGDATNDEDALNLSIDQAPIAPEERCFTPVSGTPTVETRKVGFNNLTVPELNELRTIQSVPSTDTVGSLSPRHALRRFDSPKTKPKIITPQADKKLVENLMTDVIAKQLHLPSLVTEVSEDSSDKDVTADSEKDSEELPTDGEATESDDKEEEKEEDDNQQKNDTPNYSKMKNLGTFANNSEEQSKTLHKTGGTRREVLTAIMTKGMSGSHIIAEQAATGAKRHLQDLERRVAVEALLTGDTSTPTEDKDETRKELLSLGISSSVSGEDDNAQNQKSEDDETLEAIRLLLIQYRVVRTSNVGEVEMDKPKMPKENRTIMHNGQEFPEIDAGDVDSRLVGCGVLPPAVLQALTLWKGEMISNGELLELVKKDLEFEMNLEQNTVKLNEDAAFWGRFAFGERWAEKRSRIAALSPDSNTPGWDLTGIIVKSNDDLRQESFVMQLIELCHEAFQEAELELWLLPYRIISTGRSTGIMGLIRNAMSFDGLKKRPGYGTGGLRGHLQRMTEHEANPGEAFRSAQKNFVRSLAAYSLLSYMFLFKDRHNGNIMLDTDGHVVHIDFGFVFGIAPGGKFSFEMATPFKLTEEMIDVMDGLKSSLFSEFITLFCCGFLALQAHYNTFVTLVEVTSRGSTFPCFDGRDTSEIIQKMEERFCPDLNKEESVAHVLDVIKESVGSYGTKQYDYFQYMSQGIAT